MRWPKESNEEAEGDESDGCRRRIRRLKKSKGNHKFCTLPCSIERIVYLLIPTSNHNCMLLALGCPRVVYLYSYIKPQLDVLIQERIIVVYLLIPTSNHNTLVDIDKELFVVYLLIPTSNHNSTDFFWIYMALYIF